MLYILDIKIKVHYVEMSIFFPLFKILTENANIDFQSYESKYSNQLLYQLFCKFITLTFHYLFHFRTLPELTNISTLSMHLQ